MAQAKRQNGGWGGLLFAAFIAACAFAPALAGILVVGGILWLVFASTAKFKIGNNPALIQSGQRGHADVVTATRSQVRSRSGNGPWQHTWTIVLDAQPPRAAGYRVTTYRKIPEGAGGPQPGQRFAAWFAEGAPQSFHIDWNTYSAPSSQVTAAAPTSQPPKPQRKAMQGQTRTSAPRPHVATPAKYSVPADTGASAPLVEADGGWDFDFTAQGIEARARIEDFAEIPEDGSTEMALTVIPRGGLPNYRTVVSTYVPYDRKFQIAKGGSLRLRVDPRKPGRLMIVG